MKAAESLALIIVLAVAAPVRATVIVNGDFSANAAAFTNSPGYTGGANPVTISNWLNYFNAPQQGLNGARTGVGNTFGPTNTGGRTYAFIQSAQTLLGQYLTLAPSTKYRLDYEVAARAGQAAKYRVMVAPSDSSGTSGLYYDSGVTAGNSAAFDHVTAYFTTPSALGASPNIQLWNSSDTGDSTISYANVSLSVTPRKAKLFLFAGQSNMVGMGDRNALTTEERQALTNVLVFVADPNHAPPQALSATRFWVPPQGYLSNYTAYGYAPGNAWNAVNPGHYDLVDNSYGPEYTTVRDIANALGETIYMAKYAQGGSGLDYSFGSYNASWYPYAADPGTPAEYTLSIYHSMLRWATNALSAARQSEPETELAGFFWLQGEADATGLSTANRYNANLTSFFQRLRSDVSISALPIVIGRIANQVSPSMEPYLNTVRAAQAAVAAATTNAVMVDTDGLPMDTTYQIHYTGDSLKTVGVRFAQAWLNLNRPPSVANGTGATNVLITAATLTGSLIATGGAPTVVSIYWGPADGGTGSAAWSNHVSLGTLSGGPFSTAISGLAAGTSYFYRCQAQNAFGETWANSTASFTTLPPGGPDNDHDGLPDAWEIYYFGSTNAPKGGPADDYDQDRTSNLAEFIAGSVPTNSTSRLALVISRANNSVVLSFPALRAAGPGYEGWTRRYTIEKSTNPASGGWQELSGWAGVIDDDSNKSCTNQTTATAAFYRLRVELK